MWQLKLGIVVGEAEQLGLVIAAFEACEKERPNMRKIQPEIEKEGLKPESPLLPSMSTRKQTMENREILDAILGSWNPILLYMYVDRCELRIIRL